MAKRKVVTAVCELWQSLFWPDSRIVQGPFFPSNSFVTVFIINFYCPLDF